MHRGACTQRCLNIFTQARCDEIYVWKHDLMFRTAISAILLSVVKGGVGAPLHFGQEDGRHWLEAFSPFLLVELGTRVPRVAKGQTKTCYSGKENH